MTNVDYIITARHYAEREGAADVRGRILKMQEQYRMRGIVLKVLDIDKPSGNAVNARIWQGQWVADCECTGVEFVEPTEPIFYCFSCGNRENGNRVRPVMFPENYAEIEAAILARPVNDRKGITDLERAGLAQAAVVVDVDGSQFPLVRSWDFDETLEEVLEQNSVLDGLVVEAGSVVVIQKNTNPAPAQSEPSIDEVNNVIQ